MKRAVLPVAAATVAAAIWSAFTGPLIDGPFLVAMLGVAALLTINYHLEKK